MSEVFLEKIILKVEMHCEDSKRRVMKVLIPFTGLEMIDIDMDEQTVTLKGKVNLEKLVDAVRKKFRNRTQLIFPLPNKELPEKTSHTTLELKVDMNCKKCAHKVREVIFNIDGVTHVTTDLKSNKVVVKGHNIDGEKVCYKICNEAGRPAQIMTPKKDKKEEIIERICVINNHYYPYQSTFGNANANNHYYQYQSTFSDENANACTIM